jgi:hypothetical protein
LPALEREIAIKSLSDKEIDTLHYDWEWWARPNQLPPEGDWRTWLLLAGRGFGKTRTGSEWVHEQIWGYGRRRIALVAPTAADARDIMIEGTLPRFLCIGDSGAWPGNDFELLSAPLSLSVDRVSVEPDRCWNLLPAGVGGSRGLLALLLALRPVSPSGFQLIPWEIRRPPDTDVQVTL